MPTEIDPMIPDRRIEAIVVETVVVEGACSALSRVVRVVPQGSVLRPVQFLTHISTTDKNIQRSSVSSFATDTRLFKIIKNEGDFEVIYE